MESISETGFNGRRVTDKMTVILSCGNNIYLKTTLFKTIIVMNTYWVWTKLIWKSKTIWFKDIIGILRKYILNMDKMNMKCKLN